jgi:cytochrome P450/NADPH-cytochrome P450 reductase
VDTTSPFGRSKRHIVLRLPEGTTYAPGDHLAVLPENPPEQVERVARRFGLSLDDQVVLRRPGSNADAPFLPLNQPVLMRYLLGRHIELSSPATRRDLERLTRFTQCPPEKMRLEQLLALDDASFREAITERRTAVIDLLEQCPACALPFGVFLEMAPPLRPRRYSIASSPLAEPRRCVLTVAVVEAMAWSGLGRFRGACSSYLQRSEAGQTVATSVHRNPGFHLPEDPSAPLVLIAAGTGLAPFRGFIEHRSLKAKAGAPLGPALLFFGCDHPDVDFLYRDELAVWEAEGVVQVFPAFCRFDPESSGALAAVDREMFVQHRLWEERERVKPLLDQGAYVYVCGDGRNMTPAVHATLARIGEDGGEAWLERLEKEGRYRKDVFGG